MLRYQTALAQLGEVALNASSPKDILSQACCFVRDALRTDVKESRNSADNAPIHASITTGAPPMDFQGGASLSPSRLLGTEPSGTPPLSAETDAALAEADKLVPVAAFSIGGKEGRPPFGVLWLESRRPRHLTGAEQEFLRSYVNLLSAAVDRQRVSAEENERRERLRLALNVGEMSSLEIDLETGIVSQTARHDLILGCGNQPVGWTYHRLIDQVTAEDRARVDESFRTAIARRAEWRCEFRITRADDGATRWVEARGRPLGPRDEAPTHLIGVLADITERKQAQQTLQRSNDLLEARLQAQQAQQEVEARLRFAMQAGRLGAWELDMRTGELDASEVCREHFGSSGGGPFSFLDMLASIHTEDRDRISAAIERCAASGGEFDSECRILRPNGTCGWVQMQGRGVSPAGFACPAGRSPRMAGISLDITERVQSEQRIRHSQRVEAVGRLTAGVAHDFNNVLQVLLGGLELSLEEAQDRPELRANLDLAFQAGQRGARLTSHLLSFSRQQVLHPAPLLLLRLLRELARTLERTLGHDVVVRVSVAPGLPRVMADASHLDSALLNLALNSRDAMPHGGELRIEAFERDGQVVIAVTDTGQGMTPDILAHACEPFFSTKGAMGSGLGLSMAQGFASQSGGELRLQSAPDQGTRVEICLPIAAVPAAPVPAHEKPTQRGRGSVLVVDDDADVARITAVFMRKAGFDVTSVSSSNQALSELCLGTRFDALVTDFAMPGMNGTDLVLEARELHSDLPALVITGYAGAEGLERLPSDVAILRKPFQRDRLVNAVKTMVARKACALAPPA